MTVSVNDKDVVIGKSTDGSLWRWPTNTLTYSFLTDGHPPAYWTNPLLQRWFGDGLTTASVFGLTEPQKVALRSAVAAWEAIADIHLQETTSSLGDIIVGAIDFLPH